MASQIKVPTKGRLSTSPDNGVVLDDSPPKIEHEIDFEPEGGYDDPDHAQNNRSRGELLEELELSTHAKTQLEFSSNSQDSGNFEEVQNQRQFSKLLYDPKLSAQKRREGLLKLQQKRRDILLDKLRHLEGESGVSDSEPDEPMDFLELNEIRKKNKTRRERNARGFDKSSQEGRQNRDFQAKPHAPRQARHPRNVPPIGIMLSEWLMEKPEDFEDKWLGVFCPVGKRSLVVANRGKTKVYSRTGHYQGAFRSLLPGGQKRTQGARGVTILDCLYSEESNVFYILDIISWSSYSYTNCDTESRQFFLTSKLAENPEVLEVSQGNQIPFVHLPFFKAEDTAEVLTYVYPTFPEKVDGIIFFHKEAFYIPETNPLCLWILLVEIPKYLSLEVAPELMEKEEEVINRRNARPVHNKSNPKRNQSHDEEMPA